MPTRWSTRSCTWVWLRDLRRSLGRADHAGRRPRRGVGRHRRARRRRGLADGRVGAQPGRRGHRPDQRGDGGSPSGRPCPTAPTRTSSGRPTASARYTRRRSPRRRRRAGGRPARRWRPGASALVLDFVPNHVAPDHPWTVDAPGVLRAAARPTTWPPTRTASSPSATPSSPVVAIRTSRHGPRCSSSTRRGRVAGGGSGRRRLDRRPLRRRALRHGDARCSTTSSCARGVSGPPADRRPTAASATGRR